MHDVTRTLVTHYDACLERHGPTPRGMDWGDDPSRLAARFHAIGRAIGLNDAGRAGETISLLDVGCGCGLLLDHLRQHYSPRVRYTGLDASANMIETAMRRHPDTTFIIGDIATCDAVPRCDWVVANGLLTERLQNAQETMIEFAKCVITAMFDRCREGIVFNVMSTHVNFQDPGLFYWDPADILSFAAQSLSRHVAIFHDLESYDCFYCVRRTAWQGAES